MADFLWERARNTAAARPMKLGLERVAAVLSQLQLAHKPITVSVAGTNGKGSVTAMLDAILRASGYRVGLYQSPHLISFHERIRINGVPVDDTTLDQAYSQVLAQSGSSELTEFELDTLVAAVIFANAQVDIQVLEVGLGGRLDAVNVFDADCAIVTSIDLDHMEYLGHSREAIALEKAGIFRAGKPAIVGDPVAPQTLIDHGLAIGAQLRLAGRDFGIVGGDRSQWQYWNTQGKKAPLAYPALRGANQLLNAAAVLAALDALKERLPVAMGAIRQGLITVELPGRFQVLPGKPAIVLDVAHNPHAAGVLSENLSNMGFFPETWAVFGMLADKDIAGVVRLLRDRVDHWLPTSLPGPRGASAEQLATVLQAAGVAGETPQFASPAAALAYARAHASENDRILVFGSFLTVADVIAALRAER